MATVTKLIKGTSLKVTSKFSDGNIVTFRIARDSEQLAIQGPNIDISGQTRLMKAMKPRAGETSVDRINRFTEVAKSCETLIEFFKAVSPRRRVVSGKSRRS